MSFLISLRSLYFQSTSITKTYIPNTFSLSYIKNMNDLVTLYKRWKGKKILQIVCLLSIKNHFKIYQSPTVLKPGLNVHSEKKFAASYLTFAQN
jgi:hypothetical protein